MRTATLGKRILCLWIAIGYFFFSCLYVTRCPKITGTTQTGNYLTLHDKTAKQNGPVISSTRNSKSIPALFLSRPRVIFGKNIVVLGNPCKLIRTCELCTCLSAVPNEDQGRFWGHKVFYAANILSIIHTWKIWTFSHCWYLFTISSIPITCVVMAIHVITSMHYKLCLIST